MAWETRRKSGEGPHRNGQPADEQIRDDVRNRLADDPGIDASDVEVRVEARRVILEGTVTSELTRQMAEVVAYEAEGVTGVENALAVRARRRRDAPPAPARRDKENPIEPGTGSYLEASVSPQPSSPDTPFDPDNRPGLGTGGMPADTSGSPVGSGVNLAPGLGDKVKRS